jgi:hypothetical protein
MRADDLSVNIIVIVITSPALTRRPAFEDEEEDSPYARLANRQ